MKNCVMWKLMVLLGGLHLPNAAVNARSMMGKQLETLNELLERLENKQLDEISEGLMGTQRNEISKELMVKQLDEISEGLMGTQRNEISKKLMGKQLDEIS